MISPDVRAHIESFEAIFFDLDGTLVDLHIEWNKLRIDMRAAYMDVCAEDIPETGINNLLKLVLDRGCANARQIAAEVLDKHESSAQFEPIQEAIELFKSMLGRKKIAVVTNNLHSTAERVLKSLDLLNQDVCIIGFDNVQHSKPNPEGILFALRKLGITKDQAVMIGDRDSDKKAAYNAQIFFCHVKKLIKYV